MAVLTTVVGHTTMTTSRILVVSDQPSRQVRLAYRNGGGAAQAIDLPLTAAAPYGLALFELKGLEGGSVTYAAADFAPGEPPDAGPLLAGAGAKSFPMQPEGPPRIALVSCNDIDAHQFPSAQRGAMWRRLRQLVDDGQVDLIVHAGDQIYGDGDPTGWRPEQGRTAAYRQHYVKAWSHPDVAAVLGRCPSIMMWDDHEIFDGYGSNDNDPSEKAQERFRAATQAFREFQAQINPPATRLAGGVGWCARYGDVAVLAVDGRTNRRWSTGTILGEAQLQSIEATLGQLNGLKHLFVVVGTPVVFIPLIAGEKLAEAFGNGGLDDIRDGWGSTNNLEECRRFLMRLLSFAGHSPETMVTILGGDVHIGSLAQIDTRLEFGPMGAKRRPRLYQVTSSGIARPAPSGIAAHFLAAIMKGGTQNLFNTDIQGSLLRVNGSDHAFCITHRNFAVLDPTDGAGALEENGNLRVRFHTEMAENSVLQQLLPKR